jgi:hypothetical protein
MKTLGYASSDGERLIDFEPVFKRLNEELIEIGQSLELVCAGGYVMQLQGHAATTDIDAFYKSNTDIEAIIRKIGDEFHINKPSELWLNNSISNFNDMPPDKFHELKHNMSNLKVSIVDILYVVGMKLSSKSARDKDLNHVASFLKNTNNKQPLELSSKLVDMGFFDIDISTLLESYGNAYGLGWLAQFYEENETKLQIHGSTEICKLTKGAEQ